MLKKQIKPMRDGGVGSMATAERVVLINKNPATFTVDPDAYDTSDLLWDGSFDSTDYPADPDKLYQYASESGYLIGDGKLLGECSIIKNGNTWTLTITAVSDIDPLVWEGTQSTGPKAVGTYQRTGGTDQTSTLEIDKW